MLKLLSEAPCAIRADPRRMTTVGARRSTVGENAGFTAMNDDRGRMAFEGAMHDSRQRRWALGLAEAGKAAVSAERPM